MIQRWFKDMFGESKFEVGATDTTLLDRAALAAFPVMLERAKESAHTANEWHARAVGNAWIAAQAFMKQRPKA